MLQWQAEIRRVISAVDPTATVFIMCRGGGEGVGTADLKAFGSLDHLALDYHDYFNGIPGIGLTSNGNDWTPSWPATPQPEGRRDTPAPRRRRRPCSPVPLQQARPSGGSRCSSANGASTPASRERSSTSARCSTSSTARASRGRAGTWRAAAASASSRATGSPTAEAIQLENALRRRDYAVTGRAAAAAPGTERARSSSQLGPLPEPPHERRVRDARDHEVDRERRDAEPDASGGSPCRRRRSTGPRWC